MELIVVIQESLPYKKMDGPIGQFVSKLSEKQYKAPFVSKSWSKIRPREIRIFNFTIPEAIEEEVLLDLAPYSGARIDKLSNLIKIPILKGIISNVIGIKPIDMEKYIAKVTAEETRSVAEFPIYLSVIGKIEDGHTEDGIELL